MNEIQKTTPGVAQQPQQIEQVKTEVPQEVQAPVAETVQPEKEIKEIPDNPADRSVVKPDNLETDLQVLNDNPKLVQAAIEVGDLAAKKYAEAGVENPEEEAARVADAFVKEFKN
jgi:hypothetical protein